MSAISPEEMRYVSISTFGLIIFTTLLKWTGVGSTRFKPGITNSSIQNTTSAADRTVLDSVMDPDLTGSQFDFLIDAALTPLQFFIDLITTWESVIDAMGFTSIFVIVPMLIMLVVLVGGLYKLIEVALP